MKTTLQTLSKRLLALGAAVVVSATVNAQCATSTIITGQTGGNVNFLNQSSYSMLYTGYTNVSFGDGSSYTGSGATFNTSHTYTHNGTYVVQSYLYSYDPMDSVNYCNAYDMDTVVISGLTGCNLQANVYAYDAGNLTASIFGSANNYYTSGQIVIDYQYYYPTDSMNITFPTAGSHTVCYYVEDSTIAGGCYDSTCVIVTVGNPPVVNCSASFFIFPDSLNPSVWYGVNNSSTGNPAATTYTWDFGDGTTSNLQYPSHQYAVPGNYIICLTVFDAADSCSASMCDSSAAFRLSTNAVMGSLSISAPTGIKENNNAVKEVKLYPNPMADQSSVSFNSALALKGKLEVVGVLGNVLVSQEISIAKGSNEFSLNTTNLANGVYYVNIVADGGIITTVKAVK